MARFLSGTLFLIAFFILSNDLVCAQGKCKRIVINEDGSKITIASCNEALTNDQRNCTITVVMEGDTKIITINCHSSYTDINNENIYRHPEDLKKLENDIFDKSKQGQQAFKDRTGGHSSTQSDSNQRVTDTKEKEQKAFDNLKIKKQEQKDKAHNK